MLIYALICLAGVSVHGSLCAGYLRLRLNEDGWTKRAWEMSDLMRIQAGCAAVWVGGGVLAVLAEIIL